jgi:RND family efflux transporter MFP subunit
MLLVATIAVAVPGCQPPKPPPPPAVRVTVSQPQTATVTNWDEYPGHLEAVETVGLRPRVPGYINSIHFQDGAEVKASDLLFVIDPRPFEAEMEHARAQRAQAETHLEWTRNDLKRVEGLRGTKAISEEDYDARSKSVQEAEAALAAARAAETTARINLDFTQIRAPISGRIGRRLVTVGNYVQLQGDNGAATVLATIVSLVPIYAYFDVEEGAFLRYRGNAQAGASAALQSGSLTCELGLVNEAGFPHQGRLDFFDNQVNPRTGTIRLRAVFENGDRALVPGMFSRVRVPAGPPEQSLLVPEVAVGSDQGYKFVYVVNPESKVEVRSIEVGRTHGTLRSVVKGLKPEDQVVINGLMMLRPGARVEVQSQSQPATRGSEPPPERVAARAQ